MAKLPLVRDVLLALHDLDEPWLDAIAHYLDADAAQVAERLEALQEQEAIERWLSDGQDHYRLTDKGRRMLARGSRPEVMRSESEIGYWYRVGYSGQVSDSRHVQLARDMVKKLSERR